MTSTGAFTHEWVSPPGDTVEDLLEEREWTKADLANRLGVTRKHVNELVKGRATINPKMAQQLERVFGAPAEFWLEREAKYRTALERQEAFDELQEHSAWLKELPLNWMIKKGWLPRRSHVGFQVAECLKFFGVASVDAWREHHEAPLAAYRASPSFERKNGAVAAWLCERERQASLVQCRPHDPKRLKRSLTSFRALTNEADPEVFVPKLIADCGASGVAVIILDYPPGCPVSGATKWLTPEKALLMLSLRHKSNDHLWFSFFHEVGHILLHGKKMVFIEWHRFDSKHECEADRFARDLLIPPADAKALQALGATGVVSKAEVTKLARRIGVPPGIVVGRMQKEGWLPQSHLNGLRVHYQWQTEEQ